MRLRQTRHKATTNARADKRRLWRKAVARGEKRNLIFDHAQLRAFADYLARAQLRVIEDQIALLASRDGFAPDAAFVGAGVGRSLVARLAQARGRAVHDFADFVPASEALRAVAADCAPAVGLALLR